MPTNLVEEVFFGSEVQDGQRHTPESLAYAREICGGCPVWWDCVMAALEVPASHDLGGIFGGFTAAERRSLRADREHHHGQGCVWSGGDAGDRRKPRRSA